MAVHPDLADHPILGRRPFASREPILPDHPFFDELWIPILFCDVALSMAREGDWDAARKLLSQCPKSQPSSVLLAYFTLRRAEGLGEKERKRFVKEAWKEMSRLDQEQEGMIPLPWLSKANRLMGKDTSLFKDAIQKVLCPVEAIVAQPDLCLSELSWKCDYLSQMLRERCKGDSPFSF